ncbi:hypothetical protein HDU98_006494 [Podochytrium sp. JEL0797]|nr:hypothetical protein HDU98_006494 [Podochytrium sp. JEL0797]
MIIIKGVGQGGFMLFKLWRTLKKVGIQAQGMDIRPYLGLCPKLHIPVHGNLCQPKFYSDLTMGSGTYNGETCERAWSEYEHHVGSTQRETKENRGDSIFHISENSAVSKSKSFIPFVSKSFRAGVDNITGLDKSMKDTFVDTVVKSYADTVAENLVVGHV